MKSTIITISGLSGSGKDTAAEILSYGLSADIVGLMDPLKRFMMDMYGFTYDSLFSDSQKRNFGDDRYPVKQIGEKITKDNKTLYEVDSDYDEQIDGKNYVYSTNSEYFLSPRVALRTCSMKLQNTYLHTFEDKLLRVCKKLSIVEKNGKYISKRYGYSRSKGIEILRGANWSLEKDLYIIVPDVRFESQVKYIKQNFENVVSIYIDRPSVNVGNHVTEKSVLDIDLDMMDYVIKNDRSLAYFELQIKLLVNKIQKIF